MKKLLRKLALLLSIIPGLAYAEPGEVTFAAALLAAADTAAAFIVANYIIIAEVALAVYGAVAARRRAAQAAAEARDKYNSNLIDRVTTVVNPNPPWRVVYGHCITGGDIVAIFTSDKIVTDTNGHSTVKPDAYKHMVIHIATHQVEAIYDTIIAGIRVGTLDADGWVHSQSAGTGEGYSISANCQVGETQIPLAGGTGTILVGDSISFVGDPTRYTVVNNPGSTTGGITASGQTLTIAAPGLTVLTTSGTFADLGHEFARPQTTNHQVQIPANGTLTVPAPIHAIVAATYNVAGGGDQSYTTPTISSDRLTMTNPVNYPLNVTYTTLDVNPTVRVSYHLGAPDQTVDTFLQTIAPVQWDSTHRLRGMAYAVVTLDLQDVRFQQGPPQISFDVSGALVHDPRSGATAFSSNPALICRDFLTKPYGFGVQESDIDDTYTIAAANACDTPTVFSMLDVTGTLVTQTMPQYTANGSFTTADSPEATLTNLSTSMAGTCAYGGQWMIMAGVWTPSVMDLGDDDLDGVISIVQAGTGLDELFNSAHATYLPLNRVSPQDITPVQIAAFLAADGAELWSDYTLPWTDSEVRARSLCRIFIEKNRNGLVIQYPAKLKAWPVRVGDRVRVSSTEYGFSLKYFRVTDWQFSVGSSVTLTLEEDGPDAYDQADAVMADPTPNTLLPNPFKVDKPKNVTVTTGTATLLKQADGTMVPRILVTWDANTSAYLADNGQIEVAWRLQTSAEWNLVTVDGTATEAFITGVKSGTLIVVRVTAVNSLLARSDSVFQGVIVVGKEAPPVDVAGLTLANTSSGLQVSWTPNTEVDYLETEVHIESTITWNDATTPVFRGSVNTFVMPYPAAGSYNFLAKHRDTSGHVSADASYITFTVAPVYGGGVAASITGQGALATLNTVGTGQIDPGAVTDYVETTAVGPVSDSHAAPYEIIRVSYGPYSYDVTVDVTLTAYNNATMDPSFVGPFYAGVSYYLSDGYSGNGAVNYGQPVSSGGTNPVITTNVALTKTVVLPAGTTSYARLMGGNQLGGSGGTSDWYSLDLKAVVRKR